MKNAISTKRTDNKGRILKTGESQRQDGRYAYKYLGTDGKPKFLYSWRLNETDPLPKGKRACKSLRELEKEILRDNLDGIDSIGKKMTVCQLYEKQNALKPNVRKSTVNGRKQLMDILKADKLGSMSIDKVKPSDTKEWAIRLKDRFAYQTINNHKRSLKAAFYTAIEDDLIRKNPFNWNLSDVIDNDTEPKIALTDEQKKSLLSFAQADTTYSKYYRAIVVLLYTGLRISELCGLTVNDIDFENGFINIDHQIVHDKDGYYIAPPKTENSVRQIPMFKCVRKALKEEIQSRNNVQPMLLDGCSNFIFLNRKGYPMYASLYSEMFASLIKKYNKCHKGNELPKVTPHTMRHTFCTNMANKRMTPNTLQYIMGHKNITMTLGYYTHGSAASAKAEMDAIAA